SWEPRTTIGALHLGSWEPRTIRDSLREAPGSLARSTAHRTKVLGASYDPRTLREDAEEPRTALRLLVLAPVRLAGTQRGCAKCPVALHESFALPPMLIEACIAHDDGLVRLNEGSVGVQLAFD
ncbi:MAG TPA: hypothetical protein VIV60_36580, partial [Polyangiaceae bacterium]